MVVLNSLSVYIYPKFLSHFPVLFECRGWGLRFQGLSAYKPCICGAFLKKA